MLQSILSKGVCHAFKGVANVRVIQFVRNESKNVKPEGKKCMKPEGKKCPSKHTPLIPIVCENIYAKDKTFDDAFEECMLQNSANIMQPCTKKYFYKNPCSAPLPKDAIKHTFTGTTAWENPPCDAKIKNTALSRHDFLYLKPETKCYQRTWCEFPPNRCKVKIPRCEQQRIIVAEMERRPRGQINKAATKSQPPICLEGKCPKIPTPGCRRARDPPKCLIPVTPKCCKKRCTQYPSFSECCRQRPKSLRQKERDCLEPYGICVALHPVSLKSLNDDD